MAPSSGHPLEISVYLYGINSSLSPLFSGLTRPSSHSLSSSEMFQTPHHLCGLCWILFLSFLNRGARTGHWTLLQMCLSRTKGQHRSCPAGHTLPNAPIPIVPPAAVIPSQVFLCSPLGTPSLSCSWFLHSPGAAGDPLLRK